MDTIILTQLHKSVLDSIFKAIDVYCDLTAITFIRKPHCREQTLETWLQTRPFEDAGSTKDFTVSLRKLLKVEVLLRNALIERTSKAA